MAIVEEEVRNDSEEENEVEVVVAEFEGEDHDSDESEEDDDDEVDAALERKVAELELMVKNDPYGYDNHIELVKALWALSDLERWRSAFDRVIGLMALKPEDWLLRLRTETSLSHSPDAHERIAKLFEKAIEDCYSVEILSEWCSWSVGNASPSSAREQLGKILDYAGADPLSGKVFWDALFDYEKSQLGAFGEDDQSKPEYKEQKERICRCLEDLVSRPVMRVEEAWPLYEEYVTSTPSYELHLVEKTKKRHEMALEFLKRITRFEDQLLTIENETEEKLMVYEDYLEVVNRLFQSGQYEPHYEDTVKALYNRATSECPNLHMLLSFAKHTRKYHPIETYRRALRTGVRRWPRTHHFWTLQMQQAERDKCDIAEVHMSLEAALLYGMESCKQGSSLWLSYLQYKRRQTDFSSAEHVDRLRSTFRLAWDSLAECYGEEANDNEIPIFWARLEYERIKAPKEGREIFEEIFKYGENRSMSKYWEALIRLEMRRSPPLAEHKLRDLFKRALKAVTDYPPAIVTLWTDYEQDYGTLDSLVECNEACEKKIQEWHAYYQNMEEHMTGKKNAHNKKNKYDKNKKQDNKKQSDKRQPDKKQSDKKQPDKTQNSAKQEHNKNDGSKSKGKRKTDAVESSSEGKRKREDDMDVDTVQSSSNNQGVKRSHSDDEDNESKRLKVENEDARAISREACTLFVSNLEFKINEQSLRENLSKYGDIVSFRVRSGVKAFGGSICYCQYKNVESVDKALQHDRSPLDGRPMFFSRYSAKKTKPQFKYATSQEMNKLFVKNLPFASCNKEELTAIFEAHGKLNDVRIVTNKDGKPRGLAYIDYADEESASKAIEATNGLLVGERNIEVAISAPPAKGAPALGLPKRDAGGGMRRTQLSSFIPSVLQKPVASTSKAADATENKPKSNSDFRSLLLRKKE